MPNKPNPPRSFPVHIKVLDESQGIVEAIVSVFYVRDAYNERVLPSFFDTSQKMPKICWGHDWNRPLGKTLAWEVWLAGDPRLPEEIRQYGGLYVKGQFLLTTQDGREMFSHLQFGSIDEFSFGFGVIEEKYNPTEQCTDLIRGHTYEWSPVLVGANPATVPLAVKGNGDDDTDVVTLAEDAQIDPLAGQPYALREGRSAADTARERETGTPLWNPEMDHPFITIAEARAAHAVKEGRVLSQTNCERIRANCDHIRSAHDDLSALLDEVEAQVSDTEAKARTKALQEAGAARLKSYLGEWALAEMTWAALRDLTDSLFYYVIADVLFYSDMPKADALMTMQGAMDEYCALVMTCCAALLPEEAPAEEQGMGMMALRANVGEALRAAWPDPKARTGPTDDTATNDGSTAVSPPAGETFEHQLEAALAAVKGCIERGGAIRTLRAESGRTLSQERRLQMSALVGELRELATDVAPRLTESPLGAIQLRHLERKARMRIV